MQQLKNICFPKLKIVYLVGYVIRKKYDIGRFHPVVGHEGPLGE